MPRFADLRALLGFDAYDAEARRTVAAERPQPTVPDGPAKEAIATLRRGMRSSRPALLNEPVEDTFAMSDK